MTKDRVFHSIRDPSRKSLVPFIPDRELLVRSSAKEGDDHWLPGENYIPCCRFKRILHDYCIPLEKPRVFTTGCKLCKAPMKIKIFPSNEGNNKPIAVDEVWGAAGPPESPGIQQLFESWLHSNGNICRVREPEMKNTKVLKPHHYYHHNLIKTNKPSRVEWEKFLFCSGCPDRHRAWIRSNKPDHYYEPLLMLIRKSKVDKKVFLTSEQREKSEAKKMLKEALSYILRSGSVTPSTSSTI